MGGLFIDTHCRGRFLATGRRVHGAIVSMGDGYLETRRVSEGTVIIDTHYRDRFTYYRPPCPWSHRVYGGGCLETRRVSEGTVIIDTHCRNRFPRHRLNNTAIQCRQFGIRVR